MSDRLVRNDSNVNRNTLECPPLRTLGHRFAARLRESAFIATTALTACSDDGATTGTGSPTSTTGSMPATDTDEPTPTTGTTSEPATTSEATTTATTTAASTGDSTTGDMTTDATTTDATTTAVSTSDTTTTMTEPARCGDAVIDPDEGCDDGNIEDGDGCDAGCVLELCGDGIVNNAGSEQCDDGNAVQNDRCDNSCALPVDTSLPADFDYQVNSDTSAWSYRFGAQLAGPHTLLPTVGDTYCNWSPIDAPVPIWNTGDGGPPDAGVNGTGFDISFNGIMIPKGALHIHPPVEGVVVLSWLNDAPLRQVDVEATFFDADGSCGDGVTWWVTHEGATLASGSLDGDGSGPVHTTREVLAGERINFIVGTDGGSYFCDKTLVTARVHTSAL